MEINCAFAGTIATPDHIRVAEDLGYSRAFVYDSPAVYVDAAITVARAIERTSTIRLGIAAVTTHTRHIITSASTLAHLATLAPGRFEIGVGTGFSAAVLIGARKSRWAEVERLAFALRELFSGKEIDWEGRRLGLLHDTVTGIQLPVDVPIWIAAEGPVGYAVAAKVGDGVITGSAPQPGTGSPLCDAPLRDKVMVTTVGTVLDHDESLDSPRVVAAVGPCAALLLHFGHFGPLAGAVEIDGYLATLDQVDAERRHLVQHRGHMIEANEYDRPFLTPDLLARTRMARSFDETVEHLAQLQQSGAQAVLYQPAGPDIPRELRTFRAAATAAIGR